jgi:hypothetical protein
MPRAEALQVTGGIVDTVAGFVPASVPRPIAKGAVAVVGGMLVLGLVQKVTAWAAVMGSSG